MRKAGFTKGDWAQFLLRSKDGSLNVSEFAAEFDIEEHLVKTADAKYRKNHKVVKASKPAGEDLSFTN